LDCNGKTLFVLDKNCFVFTDGPRHIFKVNKNTEQIIVPVTDVVEKLVFMDLNGEFYVAYLPNIIGKPVLK